MYELPYQISANFSTLFDEIDQNKARLGIKDYTVRSSTLEEIFISLSETEKTKRSGTQNLAGGPENDYSPKMQSNSFCRLFCSSFALHFKSSLFSGYICNIFLAVLSFSLAGLLSHYALRTVDQPLDYS